MATKTLQGIVEATKSPAWLRIRAGKVTIMIAPQDVPEEKREPGSKVKITIS